MTARPSRSLAGGFALFRHREFACYWTARFITHVSVQMQIVAISWQVWKLTEDPLDLGFIGLAEFLPAVVLGLITGTLADRHDRRIILIACYVIESGCAAAFLWLTWVGMTQAWPIFIILIVLGCARAFAGPASSALLPNLVPPEDFGKAVALNSMIWQVATIGGPALGGAVLLLGADVVYAVALTGIFTAAILIWQLSPRPVTRHREPLSWETMLAGLTFIWSRPVILGALSLDLFAVLFGGAMALLPIYASDILNVGPVGFGALRAAPGVGAVMVSLWLAQRPINHRMGMIMFVNVGLFGGSIIVFAISEWFWLSLAMLWLSGAVDMVSVYIRQTVVQLATPDHMRGRVSAVNSIFVGASNELGQFRAGVMGSAIGPVGAVLVGGIATVVVTMWWMKLFPALRDIDHPDYSANK